MNVPTPEKGLDVEAVLAGGACLPVDKKLAVSSGVAC